MALSNGSERTDLAEHRERISGFSVQHVSRPSGVPISTPALTAPLVAVAPAPLYATVAFLLDECDDIYEAAKGLTLRVPLTENMTVETLAKEAMSRFMDSQLRNRNSGLSKQQQQPPTHLKMSVRKVLVGTMPGCTPRIPPAEIFKMDLVMRVMALDKEAAYMRLHIREEVRNALGVVTTLGTRDSGKGQGSSAAVIASPSLQRKPGVGRVESDGVPTRSPSPPMSLSASKPNHRIEALAPCVKESPTARTPRKSESTGNRPAALSHRTSRAGKAEVARRPAARKRKATDTPVRKPRGVDRSSGSTPEKAKVVNLDDMDEAERRRYLRQTNKTNWGPEAYRHFASNYVSSPDKLMRLRRKKREAPQRAAAATKEAPTVMPPPNEVNAKRPRVEVQAHSIDGEDNAAATLEDSESAKGTEKPKEARWTRDAFAANYTPNPDKLFAASRKRAQMMKQMEAQEARRSIDGALAPEGSATREDPVLCDSDVELDKTEPAQIERCTDGAGANAGGEPASVMSLPAKPLSSSVMDIDFAHRLVPAEAVVSCTPASQLIPFDGQAPPDVERQLAFDDELDNPSRAETVTRGGTSEQMKEQQQPTLLDKEGPGGSATIDAPEYIPCGTVDPAAVAPGLPAGWGTDAVKYFDPATYCDNPAKAKLSPEELSKPVRARRNVVLPSYFGVFL